MGVFKEADYTLVRIRHREGVYVRVKKNGQSMGHVNTDDPERVVDALGFAHRRAARSINATGVWEHAGFVISLGHQGDARVVHVLSNTTKGAVALVDVRYLQLTGSVLRTDPNGTYQPVRRVVVRAGQIMIRHHERQERSRAERREIAYRRVVAAANEAIAINMLLGNPNANGG